jgi:hypothetical protein
MTKLYLNGLHAIQAGTFNKDLIETFHVETKDDLTSRGFYNMDKRDLIYLIKEDEYE